MTHTPVRQAIIRHRPQGRVAGRACRQFLMRCLRRRVLWFSALVAACSVLMQWLIMPPPLYADPYYVFRAARLWPHIPLHRQPFVEVPHQVTRLGLLFTSRVSQELLGPGQAAYVLTAAIGGCLFFVGCYLAVRTLFGDVVGLVATLLLLVHPFFTLASPFSSDVTWSAGTVLPDMPGAGLFSMGMAALIVAGRRKGRPQTYLLLTAGACFGSAYLFREFIAFMFVGIPIFLLLLRIPMRRIVVVAMPMLGLLAMALVHNALVFGDPLAELRAAADHGGAPAEPDSRLLAFNSFVRAMHDWHPLGILFLIALALNVIGWAVTRDRRLALTLVWFVSLWVPIVLQSGLLDPNDISLRGWLVRYWFAVFPALMAGGLGTLALMARGIRNIRIRASLLAALTVITGATYLVPAIKVIPAQPRDTAWNELRVWLGGRDDLPVIWADNRLGQTLTFYTRSVWGERQWHGKLRTFPQEWPQLAPAASHGPLLFTEWRGQEPPIAGGLRPSTQTGWRLLWRSSDDVLELWAR
ncbi:glycosyltransferase family 39 protein [Actinoallomurus purpureus]|uniref:ArnT family glycosyltransferase n=1 Tax=Actinoallomurus purpureus TaxID=478114 RepID=UPI002092A482|nr:glycosyltransferase family 39 protein [Actinoallomurus purpureus]MCO6006785.1 glycosyltransferase family 39 protein [Actinoallomurus purpureus]